MLNKPIVIPVRWMTAEQTKMAKLGLDETSTSETETRLVRFTHIDHYYEFEDMDDGLTYRAIQSGVQQFVTDLTLDQLDKLF